jgi:hypothetical protein
VQPIVMRYPHVHMDPSWVADGPALYWLLFRLMTQFHNFMSVRPLHSIVPFSSHSLSLPSEAFQGFCSVEKKYSIEVL